MTPTLLLLALILSPNKTKAPDPYTYQDPSVTKRLTYKTNSDTIAKWVFNRIEECDSSGVILTVTPEGVRAECFCPEIMLSNAHDPVEYQLNPKHTTTPYQNAKARAFRRLNAENFRKTMQKAFDYKPKAKRPKKKLAQINTGAHK